MNQNQKKSNFIKKKTTKNPDNIGNFFEKEEKNNKYKPSPAKALNKLKKQLELSNKESTYVQEPNSAPHLVIKDPRFDKKFLSVVYFWSDQVFRVYDNYQGNLGEEQEVWYFDGIKGVYTFIESDMNDESYCFYSDKKSIKEKKQNTKTINKEIDIIDNDIESDYEDLSEENIGNS